MIMITTKLAKHHQQGTVVVTALQAIYNTGSMKCIDAFDLRLDAVTL